MSDSAVGGTVPLSSGQLTASSLRHGCACNCRSTPFRRIAVAPGSRAMAYDTESPISVTRGSAPPAAPETPTASAAQTGTSRSSERRLMR